MYGNFLRDCFHSALFGLVSYNDPCPSYQRLKCQVLQKFNGSQRWDARRFVYVKRLGDPFERLPDDLCQGLNSHYFHIIGDGHQPNFVGVYIPIIRIPIKGGMTIPNIATFDHGTFNEASLLWDFGQKVDRQDLS